MGYFHQSASTKKKKSRRSTSDTTIWKTNKITIAKCLCRHFSVALAIVSRYLLPCIRFLGLTIEMENLLLRETHLERNHQNVFLSSSAVHRRRQSNQITILGFLPFWPQLGETLPQFKDLSNLIRRNGKNTRKLLKLCDWKMKVGSHAMRWKSTRLGWACEKTRKSTSSELKQAIRLAPAMLIMVSEEVCYLLRDNFISLSWVERFYGWYTLNVY